MVVDDHDLFRSGLRRLLELESDLTVVAAASRGEEAIRRATERQVDVVLMDTTVPDLPWIELVRRLLRASPRSAVVILSARLDDDTVLDAVLAGACGYLPKASTLPEIVGAIRAAAAGESPIAPSVAGGLLAQLRRCGPAPPSIALPNLSSRELEVLRLIARGCENSEIGARLHLSPGTIKRHVSSTLDKLGVDNRIRAAVFAVRTGLIEDGSDPRSS